VVQATAAKPPARIGIVGGGPAGLTLANALLSLESGAEEVKVYEQYEELKPAIGGGFNINGGAVILERLGMGDDVRSIANPMRRVISRTTAGGELFDIDIESTIPSALRGRDGASACYTVMRSELQRVLEQRLPQGVLQLANKVVDVHESASGVRLEFATGEYSPEFDLVVGCDGINSAVRREVTGEAVTQPVYSGIRIFFAVASAGTYPKPPGEFQQWFGDGVYCLVYTAGSGPDQKDLMAVCVHQDVKADENADWQQGADDKAQCMAILKQKGFPAAAVAMAEASERLFDIGVYYHDTIPTWSSEGRVVLLGDSAHAMPPFMGQGANQAIQDAYCLATNLGKVGSEFDSMQSALKAYEDVRKPPTSAIMLTSRLNGFIETQSGVGATVRDLLFKILGSLGIVGQIFVQNALPRV